MLLVDNVYPLTLYSTYYSPKKFAYAERNS